MYLCHLTTHLRRGAVAALLATLTLLSLSCGSDPAVLQGDASARGGDSTGAEPGATPDPVDAAQDTSTAPATTTTTGTGSIAASTTGSSQTAGSSEDTNVATVATGGAVDQINRVQFRVHETVATAAEPDSVVVDSPELDEQGRTWLIVDLTVESLANVQWTLGPENFSIEDRSGRLHPADAIYDEVGQKLFAVTVAGREYHDVRIAFETDEIVTDLSGWNLIIGAGGALPLTVPLSGSAYAHHYPLALLDGAESSISLDQFPGCDGAEYATKVATARVDLEGPGNNGAGRIRVPDGERLVIVDLELTGLAETSGGGTAAVNCGVVALWPDFVLRVDDRPTQPFTYDKPQIEGFASATVRLSFQIPATSGSLELVGGDDGAVVASWQVSLPAAVSEQGAELVPYNTKIRAQSDRPAPGLRPTELESAVIAEGGATDSMLLVDFGVRASTATNADPAGFVTGTPERDPEQRTWLVVEVDIESTVDVQWTLTEANFVLEDPAGRPHGAAAIYDRVGETQSSIRVDGLQYFDERLAFETDGLVADPTGWNLIVETGDAIPIVLPLAGVAPGTEYPLGLRTGDRAEVPNQGFPGCDAGLIEVLVERASVDIEGRGDRGLGRIRTSPQNRLILIDLAVTNLVDDARYSLDSVNCGVLALWPDFLLSVDGRLTQAFRYADPTIAGLTTEPVLLSFEIPEDTQTVSLLGGSGRTVIATWELKDAGQVLEDFGAAQTEQGTLITLDETLLFAFGEATLQQSAYAPLRRVANVVSTESSGSISIIGHTDAIGDDASNRELSLARAQAVADELEAAGVDPDRLVVSGRGEAEPVAPNTNDDGSDNPAGRAQNRRVEIYFTPDN